MVNDDEPDPTDREHMPNAEWNQYPEDDTRHWSSERLIEYGLQYEDELERRREAEEQIAGQLALAKADIGLLLDSRQRPAKLLFGLDLVDVLQRTYDGPRWLVAGLVTRGGIAMIGGEPKSAKTWSAMEIAMAIATGTRAFGEFVAESGNVAYFFAEDLEVQVRNRARALVIGSDRQLAAKRFHLEPQGMFLDVLSDDDLALIVASARKLGQLDLIVLDPLRDIHGGEEDKSDSMRNVMRRLRVLSKILGCAVMLVHHAPKATKDNAKRRPGQNLRGSSAIHGAVDSGLYLEHGDGDGVRTFKNVAHSQIKGGKSAGKFELELIVDDDDNGEAKCASWVFSRAPGRAKGIAAAIDRPNPKGDARAEKAAAKQKLSAESIAKNDSADAQMIGFIRALSMKGMRLTQRKLRGHDGLPMSDRSARQALARLLDSGQIAVNTETGVVSIAGELL